MKLAIKREPEKLPVETAPGWEWSNYPLSAQTAPLHRAASQAAYEFCTTPDRIGLLEPAEVGRGVLAAEDLLRSSAFDMSNDEVIRHGAVALVLEGVAELFQQKLAAKNAIAETVRARLKETLPAKPKPTQSAADKIAALKSAFGGCQEPWDGIEIDALINYGDIQSRESVVAVYSDGVILKDDLTQIERTISRIQLHEVCRPVTHQNEDSWHRQFPSQSVIEAAGAAERAAEQPK